MKFRFIYTFFSLSLLALVFMSNEDGRADSQGKGNTGAPGDEMIGSNPRTCVSCHNNSTSIQMTTAIELLNNTGATVSNYMPGETYKVRVTHTVASGNPGGFGFQILCLDAAEGEEGPDVAGFSNPANNVKIAIANSNGRQYAEHDDQSASNVFEVDWTAPTNGSGTVTFYSCGNAVNDNNLSSGDGAACATLQLNEEGSSSTFEADGGVKIYLYPNPVQDEMKVQFLSDITAEFDMEIFDMQGRLLIKEQINFSAGENNYFYDVNSLSKGTYLVKFSNNEKIATAKLLKL